MNNGITLTFFYYELIVVVGLIIAYFGMDYFERQRKAPFNKRIHAIPLIILAGLVLAHIGLAFFPKYSATINGFTIKIYYYALIIITGAILAAVLVSKESKRRGLNPDQIWDMLPWLLIAGIIGARLWHVLTPSASLLVNGKNPYFINPLQIFNIRQGGLGIPGAVIAGVIALWFYARNKKLNFLTWLDIAAPGLALAQGIGRWGNFFNQEIFGKQVLNKALQFFPISVKVSGNYYLATFFYEFIWDLLNMCLLLWLPRKLGDKMKQGDNFLVYAVFYALGRFFLEFIRYEDSPITLFGHSININQTVMAVIFILSAGALIWRHLKKKENPVEPVEEVTENK